MNTNKKQSSKEKTRDQILKTAIKSFKTLGYARSTTQAIAEKAGVAEITLFRHFGDKDTLFQASVSEIASDVPWEIIEKQLSGDLYKDLFFIAQNMLNFFINQRKAICMLMFESGNFPEMKHTLAQNPKGAILFLNNYFQNHIDKEIIKTADPETLSQMLISMLFGFAMGIANVNDILKIESSLEETASDFVKIFINGIIK